MAVETPVSPTNRPYAPPSSVVAILERLRSRNLPDRIDYDYLRDAGIPEGTVHRTFFALRFLGLVDGDVPSEALKSIAISTDEEYQAILAELIRNAYSEVFAVLDPATDAQDRFLNFFRRYTPASQRERMVIFFLGLCREAAIPTLDAPRQRTSAAGQGQKPQRSNARPSTRPTATGAKPGARSKRVDEPGPGGSDGKVEPQPLFGVTEEDIAYLDDNEFDEVWAALGKVARARARARSLAGQTNVRSIGQSTDEEQESVVE